MQARIALETGLTFTGRLFGAPRDAAGELVFHTGMTGYQEILSDPSYAGQIVLFTAPHIGNYGVHADDYESGRVHPLAVVVRDHCRRSFHRRAERSLDDLLRRDGVPGLSDVDTRAPTIAVRDGGSCRAAIGRGSAEVLVARAQAAPRVEDVDWVARVSTRAPYEVPAEAHPDTPDGRPFRVAVLDFGVKRSILLRLAGEGIAARVLPAHTTAAELTRGDYEGVFLSNGPGDPAAQPRLVNTVQQLLESGLPIFGICLGHQLLARALGAETVKLPFGHHGANHPVKDLARGTVAITSQNHNYAVPADSLPPGAHVTQISLNDGTVEGMELPGRPVYSVQYHPEAAPGPSDSRQVFARFRREMERRRERGLARSAP